MGLLVKVYDEYCEEETVKNGLNLSGSLDAIFEAIPFKYKQTGGASRDKVKHFCKTFSSDYRNNESQYRESIFVVKPSVDAWLQCKKLAVKGVDFSPQFSKTQFTIAIEKRGADPVTVHGVIYNSEAANCTVPNSNNSNEIVTANEKTIKELNDSKEWTVICTRLPKKVGDNNVYPEFDLTISTTRGTLLLPVKEDMQFNRQWASELEHKIKQLRESVGYDEPGRIIYSLLAPEQFLASLPAHEKTSWALLDGRSISNTKLSQLLNTDKLPDARGMFIRGMQAGRNDGLGDPESKRSVGSFQADELKSHSHEYQASNGGPEGTNPDGGHGVAAYNKSTSINGGIETRPQNIAVYTYIKIN